MSKLMLVKEKEQQESKDDLVEYRKQSIFDSNRTSGQPFNIEIDKEVY